MSPSELHLPTQRTDVQPHHSTPSHTTRIPDTRRARARLTSPPQPHHPTSPPTQHPPGVPYPTSLSPAPGITTLGAPTRCAPSPRRPANARPPDAPTVLPLPHHPTSLPTRHSIPCLLFHVHSHRCALDAIANRTPNAKIYPPLNPGHPVHTNKIPRYRTPV